MKKIDIAAIVGGTARRSLTCDDMKKRKRTTTYAHDVTDGDRSPAWRSLFDIQLIEMVLHETHTVW